MTGRTTSGATWLVIIHPPLHHRRSLGRSALSALTGDPVARGLGRRLDDGHHYLSGVMCGGAPIDAVVVGSGGTWAITIGGESGRFRKRNGHWYRWHSGNDSWVPWVARPIDAARLAGHRLSIVLEGAGLPSAVEPCLLAGHGTSVEWERDQRPGVRVQADPEQLAARIGRDEVLSPSQVDRIVSLLDPRQPLQRLAPEPR